MKTLDYARVMAVFASNLKNLREKRGMTQEKFSEISGVDRSYISGCESGQRNPSIDILAKFASALQTSIAIFFDEMKDNLLQAPLIDKKYLRDVPLPENLFSDQIATALQETQNFFTLIRHTSGINLSSIIQGNNFSGIVSNVFTRKLSDSSSFKENSGQRYPDLLGPNQIGLEVKASVNAWKGGEGHNGHSGWHIIICYKILKNGDIEITQVEIANLIGFGLENSDWKYLGSKRNQNDSQRTETYITTNMGTAKLRDGSAYLRSDLTPYSQAMLRHRRKLLLPVPSFSPFFS